MAAKFISTYAILTAGSILSRILGKAGNFLSKENIVAILNKPGSYFHALLQVPTEQIYNGIIFQQIEGYQTYAQKLFINVLITGEADKSPDEPGGYVREELEQERQKLLQYNEAIQELEYELNKTISASQATLITHCQQYISKVRKSIEPLGFSEEQIYQLLLYYHTNAITEFTEAQWKECERILNRSLSNTEREHILKSLDVLDAINTAEFKPKNHDMRSALREQCLELIDLIAKTNELINQLPDLPLEELKSDPNPAEIDFNRAIVTAPA